LGRQPSEQEFAEAYAQHLLALGLELTSHRVLLSRGPEELTSGGDDAKAYALAILSQAVQQDAAEVTRLLMELMHSSDQLQGRVTDWLRGGLEREIMGYQTLAEQRSDGMWRPVRQEWETDEEWTPNAAVCDSNGHAQEAAASDAVDPHVAGSIGLDPVCLEQSHVRPVSEPTAEAVVAQCLADNPGAWIQDVMQITKLTERKIQRTQAWKDHEEERLDDYLKNHPKADTGDVEKAFHFSPAKTVGMRAWKDHQARKQAAKPQRRVKERPLTDTMVACRADPSSADPARTISDRDHIFRVVLENADPETRACLNRLSSADRAALMDYLVTSMDGETSENQDGAATLSILSEVAQSWLVEHEQQARHAEHRGRRPRSG
jgi:hypothetical protein